MIAMKKILYPVAIVLITALFSACTRTEPDEELVAVEFIAAGESVQVTRAADMNGIDNAIMLVFDQTGTTLLHYKNLKYAAGERMYLRAGTYQIFVVANLTDDNCPGDYTAADYLSDVVASSQLDTKHLLAASLRGDGKVIMSSGLVTTTISHNRDDKTITLFRVQTKINLNVYNLLDGLGGNVISGVELYSFFTKNLPQGSYLIERATSSNPYDYTLAGYGETSPVKFSAITSKDTVVNTTPYRKYRIEILTFESRRGTVSGVSSSMYERKELAPDNALEVNILSYANSKMLNTFVLPGLGRNTEPLPDTVFGDFNIDRNCVYHVNVYIDGANPANITADSRREYLEIVVCGDLESPGSGSGADF